MTKRILILILFLFSITAGFSQNNDFGIWYDAAAEHNLLRDLEIELSASIRTFNNASRIRETFLETGLTYQLNKNISFAGSYRLSENIEDDEDYHIRHKYFIDTEGTEKLGNFAFSGRLRFTQQFMTYFKDEEDKISDLHGRFRLEALYNTPLFPVDPYISAELFYPLNKNPDKEIEKTWFITGIEYRLSGKHSIDIRYLFQRYFYPDLINRQIISLAYNLNL